MLSQTRVFTRSGQFAVSVRPHVSSAGSRRLVPFVEAKDRTRREARVDRHQRLRKKLSGTTDRPRLAVFRSNNHIYVQVIDDIKGVTLASANTLQQDIKAAVENNGRTKDAATVVGKKIAEICKEKGIEKVAFDRGGFAYHGRVQAIADAAREGGLVF